MVIANYINRSKEECQRIGICAGCFTLLTASHVKYLQEARARCHYLIVLTNFDKYILEKKGIVPISLNDRLTILSSLKCVNEAHSFEGENEEEWIKRFVNCRLNEFAADAKIILFHDEEAVFNKPLEKIVGFGLANSIVSINRKPGVSVSDIFARIRSEK